MASPQATKVYRASPALSPKRPTSRSAESIALLVGHQDATRSACGAACFMRVLSHFIPVAGALGGLPDHCPRDVARVRHEVQVLHVAQEAEAARPGLVEELMVQIL